MLLKHSVSSTLIYSILLTQTTKHFQMLPNPQGWGNFLLCKVLKIGCQSKPMMYTNPGLLMLCIGNWEALKLPVGSGVKYLNKNTLKYYLSCFLLSRPNLFHMSLFLFIWPLFIHVFSHWDNISFPREAWSNSSRGNNVSDKTTYIH